MKFILPLIFASTLAGPAFGGDQTILSCNNDALVVIRTSSPDLHWVKVNDPGIAAYVADEKVEKTCPVFGGDYNCWEAGTGALKIAVYSDDLYLRQFNWVNSHEYMLKPDERLAQFTVYRNWHGIKFELMSMKERKSDLRCDPRTHDNCDYYYYSVPAPKISYKNWYFNDCRDLSE